MFVRQSWEVVSAVSGYDCTLPLHLAKLLDLECRQEHCTEIGGQDGQGSASRVTPNGVKARPSKIFSLTMGSSFGGSGKKRRC